jgi:glycosyltransferase involved in cell wall biosynthesis
MPLNIAFVIDELEVGGSQRQLYLMATGLVERGWSVWVICFQPEPAMAEDFRAAGIPVHLIRKRRVMDWDLLVNLYRFFAEKKIDIVHAFSSTAEVFGGMAARLRGCRFVASVRNHSEKLPTLHRLAKRVVCRLADAVVANSQAGAAAAIAVGIIPERKTHIVPNGVVLQTVELSKQEARRQLAIAEHALVIVSIGRLVWEKGYETTLELAKRIIPTHPRVVFLIAGDGPLFARLLEQAADPRLTDQVRFLGERRDASRLLAAADVYLNTSVSEGLSNSIMEAMAARLAVVASAVGGTVELIEDEESGLLFPAGHYEVAERQLRRLFDDPALREYLGERAQRTIRDRYDRESMLELIDALYRNLLNSRPTTITESSRSTKPQELGDTRQDIASV